MPMTTPAVSALVALICSPIRAPTLAEERADCHEGEEAEHDGRDTRENFDDRLRDGAQLTRCVLAEIDRGHQADGDRHQHGDGGDHQRAGEQRQEAVAAPVAVGAGIVGVPDRAEEEIQRIDEGEEAERLDDQRGDDANGGQDGHGGTGDQADGNGALNPVAGPEAGIDAAAGIDQRRDAGDASGNDRRRGR